MRGYGYKGEHGPTLVRTWTVTDDTVRSLKDYPGDPVSPPPFSVNDSPAPQVRDLVTGTEAMTVAQVSSLSGTDMKESVKILTEMMISGEIGSRFDGKAHLYGKTLRIQDF
jgi:hypothetical protein